jgi:VCBS repeat-containing protein
MLESTINDNENSAPTFTGTSSFSAGTILFLHSNDANAVYSNAGGVDSYSYIINGQVAFTVTYDWFNTGVVNYSFYDADVVNGLIAGQNFSPVFEVRTGSAGAGTLVESLQVNITGANDAATIVTTLTGAVAEDGTPTANGTITVTDPDFNQNHAFNDTIVGSYGQLVITDGAWVYTLYNAAANVQALNASQTVQESFLVNSQDGTAAATVTINITGSNDGPVLTSVAPTLSAAETNAAIAFSGQVTVSDIDNGATSNATLFGIQGTGSRVLTAAESLALDSAFSLQSNGSWTFNLASPDSFAVGDTFQRIYTVRVVDGQGGQVFQTVTINLTGSNDTPTLTSSAFTLSEDTVVVANATGLANDADSGATLSFAMVGTVPGITLSSAGLFTVDTNHAAYQSLAQGASQVVTVNFNVTDENNAVSPTRQVAITVNGLNDAASIVAPNGGALTMNEDSVGSIGGTATVTDVDSEQALLVATSGTTAHGSYSILANGTYSFSLNTVSVQSLNDGQSVVDTFTLTSSDGTATQLVSVTINGGDEIFVGGAGSQTFSGTAFDDQIDGGAGVDTLDLSAYLGGVQVNTTLGTVTGAGGADTILNLENFVLTNGADTFMGGDANETVNGGNGADDIETAGGNDIVFAGGGDDLVHGGSGAGNDYYDGGAGSADTLTYSSTTTGVVVDMNVADRSGNAAVAAVLAGVPLAANTPVGLASGAEIGTDAFVNFENVIGGSGNDNLTGDNNNNVLDGGMGDDMLDGRDGDDTLIGGGGIDTITYANQTGAVQINLSDGNVNAGAQGGNDTVSGVENAILTGANDQFIGDGNDNAVTGGLGNDQLDGAGGNDTAIFVNTIAQDGLATEVEVPGLHALVLGTLSGDGLDTIQNIEHLEFRNGEAAPVVIIDIVDANAVVATVDDSATLNESELTGPLTAVTGNVLTNDINLDAAVNDVKIVTGFSFDGTSAAAGGTLAGLYGSLTLAANGSYTYTANASTNALGAGDVYNDTFVYTADDGDSGTSLPATLTFTINGVDDAAVITGATTGSMTEDVTVVAGVISATGTLTAVDPDTGESGFVATSITRPTGTFGIDANGGWSFTADNTALIIQQIGAGASLTETFNVSSIGGTPSSVTVTINGTNDNPVAGAVSFAPVPANDVLNVAANSANNDLASAIVLTGGSLTANPDIYNATGVPHVTIIAATDANPDFYTYSFTNVAFGQPGTLFTVDVDDVVGTTPIALSAYYNGSHLLTTTVDRFGAWASSLPFDTTAPGTDPSVQIGGGTFTGTLQFRIGSAASGGAVGLGLGNGYTLHVSLPGGAVLAPVAFNGTFEETNAALTTSGNVAFTDIDTNDTPQAAYTAATGLSANVANGAQLTAPQAAVLANAFSINAAGAFTFNAPSPDYLGADDVLTLNYTVDITDDHGGSTTQIVTITINGNNDIPVITSAAQTANLTESANPTHDALTASGAVTASDVDNGDGPDTQVFVVSGTVLNYAGPGSLTIGQDAAIRAGFVLNDTGGWTYDLASPDYLAAGATVTLTNTVTVSDGNGGSTTQNVVVTINGANDAPVVVGPINDAFAVNEAVTAVNQTITGGGAVGFSDVDIGNVLTLSQSAATIVYTDANDNPVDVVASGLLTQTQYDAFVLAVSSGFTVNDTDGSLTNNTATATWNFNYTAPTLDFLSTDEQLVATVTITATDAAGLTATRDVRVLIYGTNDGPVLTAGSFAPLVDTAANTIYAPLTGDISALANDLDLHDTETFALTGSGVTAFGTLTVNPNGTYSFAVNSAAVNALQTGDNPLLNFTVRVTDSQGAFSNANFTLQVTGANDNPVAAPITGMINEDDGPVEINVLGGAFDPDNTDVDFANLAVTVSGNLTPAEIASIQAVLNNPMMAVRDSESGQYSFNSHLFDTLDLGETATITFTFNVVDGNGGTVANIATVTVVGALEVITAGLDEFDNGPINGSNFGDLINGLDGDDTLNGGSGNDHIIGGEGDDKISGGGNDDNLEGNAGDDTINGGSGNDDISGGAGNDSIDGGSGSDTIDAGSGINTVNGGSGSDVLELTGDWIDYEITNTGGVITLTRTVDGEVESVTATNMETFRFGVVGPEFSGSGTAAMLANDAPIIAAQTMSVDETPDIGNPMAIPMGLLVANVNATDMDIPLGDQLSYAITTGNTDGNFTIDAMGNIYLVNALDYETDPHSFILKVVVTDLHGLTSSANVTVNVNDLNDAMGPVTIAGLAPIAENSANGTLVATANAVDPDAGTTITYSFADAQYGGAFAIDAMTGVITVADSSQIDFELVGAGGMGLIVLATSSDGSSNSQMVIVDVTDVPEPVGPLTAEFGPVYEGVGNLNQQGAAGNKGVAAAPWNPNIIGGAYARPGDAGETVTYALTDDAGGRFTIDAANGSISYTNALRLDFEASPTHSITIVATSSDGSTSTLTTVINVSDIANEVLVLTGGDYDVIGGAFTDAVDYSLATGAVFLDLTNDMVLETTTTTGTVSAADVVTSTDHVGGFEDAYGSQFGDRMYGGGEVNHLRGEGGDDYIYAGAGDDTLEGGAGSDLLIGEGGSDTISYASAVGAVYVDLTFGGNYGMTHETASMSGTVTYGVAAISTDYMFSIENVDGSNYGDRIYADSGANIINANDGSDIVYGGAGADIINGGDGNDRLIGEAGVDVLTGGGGADRFLFSVVPVGEVDIITDFTVGEDRVYLLRSAFGITGSDPLNLVIDGPAVVANTFIYNSATGNISFDADGAGGADAVVFANVDAGLVLTPAEIILYG